MPPPDTASLHDEALSVWIVEDDDLYRASVTTLLEQTDGLACTGAFGTCEAALEALEAQPPPDIVLMDLSLPGMSGTEGIGYIKALVPMTEIIVLSIHRDHDRVFEAIRAGATGYLLKTAAAGRIVEAIHEVRRGGAPINAHIARRVLHLFAEMAGPKAHYGLTQREREILELMNEGLAKKEIAERLFLSYYTIDTHVKNIYAKLHVHSRSEAILKARRERLI